MAQGIWNLTGEFARQTVIVLQGKEREAFCKYCRRLGIKKMAEGIRNLVRMTPEYKELYDSEYRNFQDASLPQIPTKEQIKPEPEPESNSQPEG